MSAAEQGRYFIGLMSGTSLDAIDLALVNIKADKIQLVDTLEYSIDSELRLRIAELFEPGANEIDKLGELDREIGQISATCINSLLQQNALKAGQISAIGSHGQTIRHRPNAKQPFTLQIGDPNTIAAETGILTIADFRRKDLALGGQGAPLAPMFHAQLCRDQAETCAILNIGGIANVSVIESKLSPSLIGFDTGPGNALMDAWTDKHKGEPFDRDGRWASEGQANNDLLTVLLRDEYFARPAPKSTGKEEFNLSWLEGLVNKYQLEHIDPSDVQATLLELSASSIADAINGCCEPKALYLCGGGARNKALVARLEALMPSTRIRDTAMIGIAPEWMEAAAFAWFAQQAFDRIPVTTHSVTGASRDAILGGFYFP